MPWPSIPHSVFFAQDLRSNLVCRVDTWNVKPPTSSLWPAILERLGLPDDSSVDAVHKALGGVVGRGTVQRLREAKTSTGLGVLERIATQLGCEVADLLAGAYRPGELPASRRARGDSHLVSAALIDKDGIALAHRLSYQPVTVPYLNREELIAMGQKELPESFRIELLDDALGARAPKGTSATFERRPPSWGDAVLLIDTKGEPHVRVYRQSLEHEWEGYAPNPNFATFNGSMSGVRVVAVLESLGGGWAQLGR